MATTTKVTLLDTENLPRNLLSPAFSFGHKNEWPAFSSSGVMLRSWWLDNFPSGTLRLYRLTSEYSIAPGKICQGPSAPILEQLELSWEWIIASGLLQFQVQSYCDVDPDTGSVLDPSDNIAGLFSFQVEIATNKIKEVVPGPLKAPFVLATIAEALTHGVKIPPDMLISLMAQDACVAAEEMSHDIWNEVAYSSKLVDSPAAGTPIPVDLHGRLGLGHVVSMPTDCRAAFRSSLLQQAAKLSRLTSSQQACTELDPSETAAFMLGGGEAVAEPKYPYRTSLWNRIFNLARIQCLSHSSCDDLNQTLASLNANASHLSVDNAAEYQEFKIVSDMRRRPLRIESTRTRRVFWTFGPHMFLSTGVRYGMTWISSWKSSPYSNTAVLMDEVKQFNAHCAEAMQDISTQYIAHKQDTLMLDHCLVSAAYLTCKQDYLDSLTPKDIEAAMTRAGFAGGQSDSSDDWFDIVRAFDFDNTGFMEFNEFYLLCHELTATQLRTLTIVTAKAQYRLAGHWVDIVVDIDALEGSLALYSDEAAFAKSSLERKALLRPSKQIEEVTTVKEVSRTRHHGTPTITTWTTTGPIEFKLPDTDYELFLKMVLWMKEKTSFELDSADLKVDRRVLQTLAIAAVHAFLS